MDLGTSRANDAQAAFEAVEEKLVPLREGLGELDGRVRVLVREHPVATLLGALTAGYFIGRLIAKR
jgi:hypothetical protein